MRRRRSSRTEGQPETLTHYRAQDWPASACHRECAYWAAVRRWYDEHPGQKLERVVRPPRAPFHLERI